MVTLRNRRRIRKVIKSVFIIIAFAVLYYFVINPYLAELVIVEGWDYRTPRNTVLYVLPDKVTTKLLPIGICDKHTFLLIIVFTLPKNSENRNAIRHTWGSRKKYSNLSIDLYFLTGLSPDSITQMNLESEFRQYNDIIQEDFLEHYYNLTIKSLRMLKVVKAHCLNTVDYVMKADDDVYINIPNLANEIESKYSSKFILGYIWFHQLAIKNIHNKWNAPSYMYGKKYYPDFACGNGYVMSMDIVPMLFAVSLSTPIYHLEDVYVTGILAEQINVKRIHNPIFIVQKTFNPCLLISSVIVHDCGPSDLKKLYWLIENTNLQELCNEQKYYIFNLF